MKWTDEQLAVITTIRDGEGNLIANAVAGSGKTTTIIEGVQQWALAHPTQRALLCAFNKRIAEELGRRITTPGVVCATMNSLGHRAWAKLLGKRLDLDTKKNFKALNPHFEWGKGGDSSRLLSLCKGAGFIPTASAKRYGAERGGFAPDSDGWLEELIERHSLDCPVGEDTQSGLPYFDVIRAALDKSIEQSFQGLIDFDDQLYMSALWRAPFETFALVMVDEAQDINAIQQRIISLCLRPGGRLVAVGDRHQAIYGFRGAGHNAIDQLQGAFGASELPLNISFRCPTAVIARAQEYVPHIRAAPDAPEGRVATMAQANSAMFLQSDAILCRNVKPLVQLCFALLRAQVPCNILGRDIGQGLVTLIKKVRGKEELTLDAFYKRLDEWYLAQQRKLLDKDKEDAAASLLDRVETILAICDTFSEVAGLAPTIDDLIHRIEGMFADNTANLTLSTIHKAKGLEWPRVWLLDPWRMPSKWARTPEALQQEHNCIYVATTRAQEELLYINLKDIKL